MDKIAIISDIHGNLEALKAVFIDIESRYIDNVYCLGDIIAKGVNPSECISLVKEKCKVVIKGNCDEFFSRDFYEKEISDHEKDRIKWNKNMLSDKDMKYLKKLPFTYEFYMSGSLIRLFHSTPYKIDEFVSNLDPLEKKYNLFLPSEYTITKKTADVVIYGHVHTQYMDQIYNKTIVNVGSVGNPIDIIRNDERDGKAIETTRANYLIIEGDLNSGDYTSPISFQFIKVPYNIDKELASLNDNIERTSYVIELIEGRYRDPEKLYKSFQTRGIELKL